MLKKSRHNQDEVLNKSCTKKQIKAYSKLETTGREKSNFTGPGGLSCLAQLPSTYQVRL